MVRLCIDDLVQEAIEAYKTGETREELVENEEVYLTNPRILLNILHELSKFL